MKLKGEGCYLVTEGILERITKYKTIFFEIVTSYEKAYQAL
jgi:hypothetical protein